jgi:RHS repeat-associated protein
MDNEPSGNGSQYDYGFRIYNPRIAKFLSVDPLTKTYPMLTPYQFASNRPIDGIDLDGLEHKQVIHYSYKSGYQTVQNYLTVTTYLAYNNENYIPGTEHIYANYDDSKSRRENIDAARGNKSTYLRYTDYNDRP